MKYHKIWKLFAYIIIICLLYSKVNAQDDEGDDNAVVNQNENNDTNNNNNNNGNNNNNDNDDNNKDIDDLEDENNHGDEEIDPECSSNIGNILFQKPDSKRLNFNKE